MIFERKKYLNELIASGKRISKTNVTFSKKVAFVAFFLLHLFSVVCIINHTLKYHVLSPYEKTVLGYVNCVFTHFLYRKGALFL